MITMMDNKLAEKANHTFWGYLGSKVVSLNDRKAVITLEVKKHHLNHIDLLHGGVHASLLDSAMGLIAMAARPGCQIVTSTINVHYTQPVSEGTVRVTAEVLHQSGRMMTTQASLVDEKGRLCSVATASFRVMEKEKPSMD